MILYIDFAPVAVVPSRPCLAARAAMPPGV